MKKAILQDRETFHLEIPADENNLGEVRDFISDVCAQAGFSNRETSNTKLAVDEACTNIIKHAYKEKGGDIRIDVQAEPGSIEINIFDRGEAFDWSTIEDPNLQEYVEIGKKGGLGIFLMNRLMDELDYSSSSAGNRLFMAKSMAGARAKARPFILPLKPRWTSTLRFKFGFRATIGILTLVRILWGVLFTRQTNNLEAELVRVWNEKRGIAENFAEKSVDALVRDEQFSVEQTTLSSFARNLTERFQGIRYAKVVNGQGSIVASTDLDEILSQYESSDVPLRVPAGGLWRKTYGPRGEAIQEYHLNVRYTIAETDQKVVLGKVLIGFNEEMTLANVPDPRPVTSLILIGVFIAGVLLIYMLVSIFVKPIQALTDGVRAIGEGALQGEIKIDGPEEIGEIARAFNEITYKFRLAQESVVEQERFQKEMQVAQEIQHSLLPRNVPDISGYEIGSLYRAAREVGGDYYDFVHVDEETVGVVVADVSGKGVPGSLVMTMIRTALRMEARGNHSAAEVMARMNDFVTEDMKKGMFVTIFYVILDSKNRIISYSSAGHNPMILYRAESDETFFLNPRGFPVGISLPDDSLFRRSIDVEKVKLKKDDMLVIYTDGVTEAMNESREQYGEEKLLALIKRHGSLAPTEFI
ncbi:MAG: SpoIIE family protein phosphatase, partial [Candidatus Krumholzibacteria bacterium]|nr:SpoIIE family protein phosphatase [Candidatus Krumholzibacteria bacterium]